MSPIAYCKCIPTLERDAMFCQEAFDSLFADPEEEEPETEEPTGEEPTGEEPAGEEPTGDDPSGEETTTPTEEEDTANDGGDAATTPDE